MKADKEYWSKELIYPYCPSDENIEIYKKFLSSGETLLLGCTHKLIPITNYQMDIDPWYNASSVIVQDWTTNTKFFDNIVGDGVLNFTKELTNNVLKMCSKYSKCFVARTFNKKLPKMRIADYFPSYYDFEIKPNDVVIFENYNFFIWNFYAN